MHQQVQGGLHTTLMVFHATQDQRTAMTLPACPDLLRGQPDRAHNALIERAFGMVGSERTAEGKPQIGNLALGMSPTIDA